MDKVVRLTLITTKEEVKVEYKISDKHAYSNAILIALDFKFSTTIPFINIKSMQKDEIYTPLKYWDFHYEQRLFEYPGWQCERQPMERRSRWNMVNNAYP